MRIPKDAQVFINDVYAEAQMCSVIYGQQIGVFKMFDFTQVGPQDQVYDDEMINNGSKQTLHP